MTAPGAQDQEGASAAYRTIDEVRAAFYPCSARLLQFGPGAIIQLPPDFTTPRPRKRARKARG